MPRYLLFAFDSYYPAGGWDDFVGGFDTLDAAHSALRSLGPREHVQIIDTETMKEVEDT